MTNVEIEKDTQDRHVDLFEVQRLVWLVREQMLKRGVTLGMIETIADKITKLLRSQYAVPKKAWEAAAHITLASPFFSII